MDEEEVEPIFGENDLGGEDDPESVDNVEKRHYDILGEAKKLPLNPNGGFKELLSRYETDILTNETEEKRTFLHTMAAAPDPAGHIHYLTAFTLANPRGVKLMEKRDNEGKTPLHLAITKANNHFLRVATGTPSQDKTIEQVSRALEVGEREQGKTTSLHAAVVHSKLKPNILHRIIQMAPKNMFRMQDAGGYTPLHLAVEARRCSGDQLKVVRALIARDPSVLSMSSRTGHSVYQHHMLSRSSAVRDGSSKPARIGTSGPSPLSSTPISGATKPAAGSGVTPPPPPPRPDAAGDGTASEPKPGLHHRKPSHLKKADDQTPALSVPSTPVEPPTKTTAAPGKHASQQATPQAPEAVADLVMNELKLQSLRIMDCDAVLRCLHTDRELWFDYEPGPQYEMTFRDFETHWGRLRFDSTLQYVALPNLHFKDEDPPLGRGRDDAARIFKWLVRCGVKRVLRAIVHDGTKMDGSSELEGYYHSNDTIASALEGLDIEILDWRRPDICPATIAQIGKSLREVHLQWSGNNAMLRAWSELQGLPMLARYKKLELIHIAVPEAGPDIGSSTKKSLQNFTTRFRTNWATMTQLFKMASEAGPEIQAPAHQEPPTGTTEDTRQNGTSAKGPKDTENQNDPNKRKQIMFGSLLEMLTESTTGASSPQPPQEASRAPKLPRIKFKDNSGGHRFISHEVDEGAGGKQKQKSPVDQHRWVQCMEEFSAVLKEVPQPSEDEVSANPALKPIAVALIDDGVDTTNPSLQKREYRGMSFDFYENGRRSQSYWVSKTGHGTIMAKFIRNICPTADIYVIKLGTDVATKDMEKLTIDIDSAIKAINHAVDQRVRIISMSWSVKVPVGDQRDRFNRAINRAIANGIIMFCAASDQGDTGDETYPYASNKGYIFRIGAATAMGTIPDYTGNDKHLQFLFPGHDVLLKDNSPEKSLGDVQRGSSIATALAAGLAGLVLECVRLGYLRTVRMSKERRSKTGFLIQEVDVLKVMDSDHMRSAFQRMSTSSTGYIRVWEFFTSDINEKLKDSTPADRLDIMFDMAKTFLGK